MSTKKTKTEDRTLDRQTEQTTAPKTDLSILKEIPKKRDLDNLPEDKIVRTSLPSKTLKDMREQFIRCLQAKYLHTEKENGDYAIEESRDGKTLYLLFQWTRDKYDWLHNFDFPATPYSDMGIKWKCHRGFLAVWKDIKPFIKEAVANPKYTKIYICGFSHGAAIATLAHEYVWFNRPDLRSEENPEGITGYGFGCPRCYFGSLLPWKKMPQELAQRWERFYPIRNISDLVTHVPPRIFGFRHVAPVVQLGKTGKWQIIDYAPNLPPRVAMHYADNYILSLDDGIKEAQELEAYQKAVEKANARAAKKAAAAKAKAETGSGLKEEK